MTVWCFGSINIDYVYGVPHLPAPGETLTARRVDRGLGGKGTNQSVAAARAGSRVRHIGAVGAEGLWARDQMAAYGIDVTHVRQAGVPTGHAVIYVDGAGENSIVIAPGANVTTAAETVAAALARAAPGDLLLLQNETGDVARVAEQARAAGLRVIYSAAPFDAAAVQAMLGKVSILVMNRGEAEALKAELGAELRDLPVEGVLVTLGGDGATYLDVAGGHMVAVPALRVAAVDTTAAGDTFTGYFAAGLDQGLDVLAAMKLAAAAAACKVTRSGAADAIPDRAEVEAFLRAFE